MILRGHRRGNRFRWDLKKKGKFLTVRRKFWKRFNWKRKIPWGNLKTRRSSTLMISVSRKNSSTVPGQQTLLIRNIWCQSKTKKEHRNMELLRKASHQDQNLNPATLTFPFRLQISSGQSQNRTISSSLWKNKSYSPK